MTFADPGRTRSFRPLGACLLLALAGCAPAAGRSPAPAAQRAAAAPSVNDPEIAAIVVAANTIDAEMGELALARSSDPEVRRFAQQMVDDHRAVNDAAVALVTRLGVAPQESAISRKLRSEAEQTRVRLSGLSGEAFDRAYIAHEIAYHQAVIDAVDGVLVPSSENPELRQTLVGVRPALVGHLEHARRVGASLEGRE